MQKYYVSLTKDLLHCYLEFEADSESAVRLYMDHEYHSKDGTWKMPWCAVYDSIPEIEGDRAIIIKARCGKLYAEDYRQSA